MLLHQKLHQRHNQQALTCTESRSVSTERAAWSRSGNETGDLDQLDLKLHPPHPLGSKRTEHGEQMDPKR
ncbi:hypothetical protein LguiB_035949 [Lonicera macranthoides]